jgi:hypothetical protein
MSLVSACRRLADTRPPREISTLTYEEITAWERRIRETPSGLGGVVNPDGWQVQHGAQVSPGLQPVI